MNLVLKFTILVGLYGISNAFDPASQGSQDSVKVVAVDTQRSSSVVKLTARDRQRIAKRQSGYDGRKAVYEGLDNAETFYFASLTLGTPPQFLRLTIDTGSADMWVNTVNSSLCTQDPITCQASGTYSPLNSSTMQFINDEFEIVYADGTGASGSYLSDNLNFGGSTLESFQFGTGYNSSSRQGVLGIGFKSDESEVVDEVGPAYPNLPIALANAGLTNSLAYSLWLNDISASTGSILFGGINTAKYHGSLSTVPILPDPDSRGDDLVIGLSGLRLDSTELGVGQIGSEGLPLFPSLSLLDSGSTMIYLDVVLVEHIWQLVTAVFSADDGVAYVPCELQNSNSTLTFSFGSANISVPMKQLIYSSIITGHASKNYSDDSPACVFGILYGSGTNVLGDAFLRSAYVVYDLENQQIALAQTSFNATGQDDIKEIVKGKDGIPDARPAESAVTAIPTPTLMSVRTNLSIISPTDPPRIQRPTTLVHDGGREALVTEGGTLTVIAPSEIPSAIATAAPTTTNSFTNDGAPVVIRASGSCLWGAVVGVVGMVVVAAL